GSCHEGGAMNYPARHHARLFLAAGLCALLTLLVSALGAGAATARHSASGPVYGGTLRSAFSDDYTFLDPAEASGSDSSTIYYTLFDGLYKDDRNGQPQLDLAAAPPTISADGKTWTFRLRKGVLFSNKTEMTAADVKYSLTRVLDPHLTPVSYCQTNDNIFVGSQAY